MRTRRVAYAAVATGRTRILRRPHGRLLRTFGRTNQNGYRMVFGVLSKLVDHRCRARWYRVQLPIRPNGSTGYISARAVELVLIRTRIEVDLSAARIVLYRGGTPSPRHESCYGVAGDADTDRVVLREPAADSRRPLGPVRSSRARDQRVFPVLTGWTQGGPIAIHGTNEPWTVGRPVSHGCLRVRNSVLERLFAETPAGTPVTIWA